MEMVHYKSFFCLKKLCFVSIIKHMYVCMHLEITYYISNQIMYTCAFAKQNRKFHNVNRHVKVAPLAVPNQNIDVLIVAIFFFRNQNHK